IDPTDGAWLEASGVPRTDELLVRRIISRSGKARAYVNGSLATAGLLGQLGEHLIHVYGQHEHALLLKPESHLELLDEFGQLAAGRQEMAVVYAASRDAATRLAERTANNESVRQRLELLRFQVKELAAVHPTRGEDEQLQQERDLQRHAEKLS